MSDTNERSVASAGSQPVAWAVEWTDHIDLFRSRSCAEHVASGDVQVQPLYRSPTLTDEEREAVRYFAHIQPHSKDMTQRHAATLCGLLDRLK